MSEFDRVARETFPFWLGDVVFHRMREERKRGLITGAQIGWRGVVYLVAWDNTLERWHVPEELTANYLPDYGHDD